MNAITGDASANRLAEQFSFRYIPASFFLTSSGKVSASHTGPLTEQEMRQQLDALLSE